MDTTAKHAIPFIEGEDPASQINDINKAQAERIDDILAIDSQGAYALRPVSTPGTPGKSGRFYFATDNKVLYRDYGTGWTPITPETGTIEPWAWATADDGWLLVNGQGVTTASAPRLREVLLLAGSPFGTDGSGNPRVPPAGCVLVPLDPSQSEFDAIGKVGGAKTHTLTIPQLPSHDHGDGTVDVRGGNGETAVTGGTTPLATTGAATTITPVNVLHQGGGQAHNNLQPYVVVNYRIHI